MTNLPPPQHVVTVFIDGRRIAAYRQAVLRNGRVLAPVDPFVTGIGTKLSYDGTTLVVSRADRFAQVKLSKRPAPRELQWTYVAVAPIVRTLGGTARYDAVHRVLDVRVPHPEPVVTPTPFNPAVPQVSPTTLFTPVPAVTPRPVFSGRPLPRRTPVPWEPTPAPRSTPRNRA